MVTRFNTSDLRVCCFREQCTQVHADACAAVRIFWRLRRTNGAPESREFVPHLCCCPCGRCADRGETSCSTKWASQCACASKTRRLIAWAEGGGGGAEEGATKTDRVRVAICRLLLQNVYFSRMHSKAREKMHLDFGAELQRAADWAQRLTACHLLWAVRQLSRAVRERGLSPWRDC